MQIQPKQPESSWTCGVCGKTIRGARFEISMDVLAHVRTEKRRKKRILDRLSGKWIPASGGRDSY